ncbi:MAG: NADH-quinone oxidoreductase subunit K [Candidatus Aminicenantes bacterium]|nr:NADH-quinone oxidoreductase subunit K [Candidatus Aminicenantes bacterium]
MSSTWLIYMAFAAILVFVGLYGLLSQRNLIKLFIGIEIISKGISLALVSTGFVRRSIFTAQALTITFIVVEVCVVATALAIIINIYRHTKSLDIRKLAKLKG